MNRYKLYTPKTGKKMSIAVFLSGSGTNFEALISRQLELEGKNIGAAKIDVVYSNVPGCPGMKKAADMGIKTLSISSKKFFESLGKPPDDQGSRELYDHQVIELLDRHIQPDLIVLAGYRRKLSGAFYGKYKNRIINLYPGDITLSYLETRVPASLQAIRNNEKEIKCTVYIDRENVRFGPAIAQSKPVLLELYNEENIDELDMEIREKAEWSTFPFVVYDLISHGRISVDDDDNVYLDDSVLPENGLQL